MVKEDLQKLSGKELLIRLYSAMGFASLYGTTPEVKDIQAELDRRLTLLEEKQEKGG